MILIEYPLVLLIGMLVGLGSVFLSLGGGLIIVPLLPLIVAIAPREAIGTSLLAVLLVALQNSWRFHKGDRIDYKSALWLGSFSAVGAFLSARATGLVSDFALHTGFGLLVLAIAIFTVRQAGRAETQTKASRQWFIPVAGFLSGIAAGFTGIGGGIFSVPILSMSKRMSQDRVVPTSVATIVLTALAGVSAFVSRDGFAARVDIAAVLFAGGWISSKLAMPYQKRLTPRNRDWLIATVLLALSIRTLFLVLGTL